MQMPQSIPPWDTLMADLGHPQPELIARALGVGRSTVYRWNSARAAPRAPALAIYWLTRWGRSELDTRATHDALMALQLVRSLTAELADLRGKTRAQEGPEGGQFCVVGTKTSPPSKLRLSRARSKPHAKQPKNPT